MSPVLTQEKQIPFGDIGARHTLGIMRSMIQAAIRTPSVVEFARTLIPPDGKNRAGQAMAIDGWLNQKIRFVRDPEGVEYIQTPEYMIQKVKQEGGWSGDCDDYAVLGASLGKAVGVPAYLEALAFREKLAPFTHVLAYLGTENGLYKIDRQTSVPFPSSLVSRRMMVRV